MNNSASVDIDGNKIRLLREQKELTQLYLATVVGVTTDTISRWENRRYPTIKLENAKKLAEALGVPLESLLEEQEELSAEDGGEAGDPRVQESVAPNSAATSSLFRRFGQRRFVGLGLFVLLLSLLIFFLFSRWNAPTVTAVRTAPQHTAPNTPFPVIIEVSGEPDSVNTLLIREELKGDCDATGPSSGGEVKQFGKNPRWIGKLSQGRAVFGYLVHPGKKLGQEDEIRFSGDTIAREGQMIGDEIGGAKRIAIAPYHWVDTDKDYVISDSEILKAYETYSLSGEPLVNFSDIEELWLAGKYKWNKKNMSFSPSEPDTGKEKGDTP